MIQVPDAMASPNPAACCRLVHQQFAQRSASRMFPGRVTRGTDGARHHASATYERDRAAEREPSAVEAEREMIATFFVQAREVACRRDERERRPHPLYRLRDEGDGITRR